MTRSGEPSVLCARAAGRVDAKRQRARSADAFKSAATLRRLERENSAAGEGLGMTKLRK
jgi:hypothetical protein